MLFIVLDQMTPAWDRSIASHVIRMHQYRKPGEEEGAVSGSGADELDVVQEETPLDADTPVFVRDSGAAGFAGGAAAGRAQGRLYTIAFLRKYLHYAKQLVRPKLTREAAAIIGETYATLRANNVDPKALPTTPRTLETLIRLATAHAKARLSNDVQEVRWCIRGSSCVSLYFVLCHAYMYICGCGCGCYIYIYMHVCECVYPSFYYLTIDVCTYMDGFHSVHLYPFFSLSLSPYLRSIPIYLSQLTHLYTPLT